MNSEKKRKQDKKNEAIQILKTKINNFLSETILSITNEQKEFLFNALVERIAFKYVSTKLLYRGSRNGWKPEDFHKHCDEKANTLTLI